MAYPSAGTSNAEVSLLLAGLDGRMVAVDTGGAAFPYLVTVSWDTGDALIVVVSRDQRVMRLLAADPGHRRDNGAARGHRPAMAGHHAGVRPDRRSRPDQRP